MLHSLESLGHDVIIQTDRMVLDRINIICIGLRMNQWEIDTLINSKVPYVVYQTEIFTPSGINYSGVQKASRTGIQERYLHLLKHATMVWELFEHNQRFLDSLNIESQLLKLGHHPKLDGLPKKQELDIDVLFCGSLTQYRVSVLKEIRKHLKIKILEYEPPLIRDDHIRRAKMSLSIPASDSEMNHLAHFRVFTSLYYNTMTLSEEFNEQKMYRPLLEIVPAGQLVQRATEILEDGSYLEKAQEFRERFFTMDQVEYFKPLLQDLGQRIASPAPKTPSQ